MTVERKPDDAGFLSRWSRRKADARESEAGEAKVDAVAAETPISAPLLPPLDELTLDSDYGAFFHPEVDENLRRSALRKLFSDPHFNVMDGLDTYIDDYSKTEPIPAAMLASLRQAQRILTWAEGKDEEKISDADPAVQDDLRAIAPAEKECAPAEPLADSPQREPSASRPE